MVWCLSSSIFLDVCDTPLHLRMAALIMPLRVTRRYNCGAVTTSITPHWRRRRLCGDTRISPPSTTAARLQTRLLCVICFFQTPNGGYVGDSGLRWRSPRAKCLASVGSASHALHDIASCFAFWREGLVCVCNALENKLNETPNVKI